MKTTLTSVALAACLFLLPGPARSATPEDAWKQYRGTYPYHQQAVALTAPDRQGGRILILSEPPPHVTKDGVKKCGPELITAVEVREHKVGHDGWVRDLVVTLGPARAPALRAFTDAIHAYLFDTTYRAECIPLPAAKPPEVKPIDLDLKVTTIDLKKWLLDDAEPLLPLAGGKARPLADVLGAGATGVFRSKGNGLVVAAFPRKADLKDHRAHLRQFALSSDLLIGGVADGKHMALIGRERVVPAAALPPLRTETLVLLSSVRSDELAQSYERNRIFAGRYEGRWDWAPILLSPELLNTEYGSLLNITDQLLKGWSLKGQVQYERFNYPIPDRWPFDRPIDQELKTSAVTFNWNTAGAGYAVSDGKLDWFALNRTGSLPMSYIPEGAARESRDKVAPYEQTGYDYYARLGDPNLIRVAGYAAAFQLFRHYRPGAAKPAAEHACQRRGRAVLARHGLKALKAFKDADADAIASAAKRLAKMGPKEQNKEVVALVVEFSLTNLRKVVRDYSKVAGDDGLKELAELLADPRGVSAADIEKALSGATKEDKEEEQNPSLQTILERLPDRRSRSVYMMLLLTQRGANSLVGALADPKEVKEEYVKAFADQPSSWIRTPSVVVSRTTGELRGAVGGHNLDAEVPTFRAGDVKAGTVRLERQKDLVRGKDRLVIVYSPRDWDRLPRLVRPAGRELRSGDLKGLLEKELTRDAVPAQDRAKALFPSGTLPDRAAASGWHPTKEGPTSGDRAAVDAVLPKDRPVLIVTRGKDGYRILRGEGGVETQQFAADNQPALLDYLKTARSGETKGALHLHFEGFSRAEAEGVIRTLRLTASAPGKGGSVVARWLGGGKDATPAARSRLLDGYDFKSAKVKEPVESRVREGPFKGKTELRIEVEVPARARGNPSLFVRLRVFCSKVTDGFVAAFKAAVARVFARPRPSYPEVFDAVADLKADLKAHEVSIEVEFSRTNENRNEILDMIHVNRSGGQPCGLGHLAERRPA